jgi:hypothetical protein
MRETLSRARLSDDRSAWRIAPDRVGREDRRRQQPNSSTGQHDDDRVWFFRAGGNVAKPGGAESEQAAGDREGCGLLPAARSQSQRTNRISPRVVVLPKRLLDHKGSRKDRSRG